MANEPKSTAEIVGDTLREIGILALVFGSLIPHKENPSLLGSIIIGAGSLAAILIGAYVEVRRKTP